MGFQFASIAVLSLVSLTALPTLAVTQESHPASPTATQSDLQKHYDAAERFQQAGQMQQAAAEYRAFIAEAAGQLATGYAGVGDYSKAASLFDESLQSKPDQPALRIEYAEAALAHGDYAHAKSLAEQMLPGGSAAGETASKKTVAKIHLILGRALLKMNRDHDAKKELETAVDLDPNFEDGYALAVTCLDMDDGKCASRIFSEMEASFGDTAIIHMEFGRAYSQSDFPQKAVAEFKKTIAKNDRLPQAHYLLAAAYLASAETSSLENAKAELKKELQISPKDFLTYAALGHIAVSQHQYGAAADYLKQAIALNPNSPDAYLYLGQMYYEMRKTAEAEAALREAIKHTTDVSRNRYQIQKAHYLLGRLLIRSGHQTEAQSEMRIAQKLMTHTLAMDESRFSGGSGMGSVEVSDEERPSKPVDAQAAGVIEDFQKRLAPPLADSYNNLGAMAASSKDYAAALACFRRAAEWNPNLTSLDYNWGHAAFMSAHFQDAVPPLTRYLSAHPRDTSIRSVLAISQFMTKNYDAVVKTLEPVLSGIDAVPQVEYVYAASLVKTGQTAAGVERLTAMEKNNPSIPDVHRSLGEAYAEGNHPNRKKAAEEFAAAIRLNPRDAEAHDALGTLDLEAGDIPAAITELKTAVRLDPKNKNAHSDLAAAYERASRPGDAQRERELANQPPPSKGLNP